MKFSIFTGETILCILHGQVFIMLSFMATLMTELVQTQTCWTLVIGPEGFGPFGQFNSNDLLLLKLCSYATFAPGCIFAPRVQICTPGVFYAM